MFNNAAIFTKNNSYNLTCCISKTKSRTQLLFFQAREMTKFVKRPVQTFKKKINLAPLVTFPQKINENKALRKAPVVGKLGSKNVVEKKSVQARPGFRKDWKKESKEVFNNKKKVIEPNFLAKNKRPVYKIAGRRKRKAAINGKFFVRKNRMKRRARRIPSEFRILDYWLDKAYWRLYSSSRRNAVGRAIRKLKKKYAVFAKKDSFIYPLGGEGQNFAENDWRRPDCLLRLNLPGSIRPKHMASYDHEYVKLFIFQKKRVNKLLIPDRTPGRIATYDRIPYKFFYLHYKTDPIYSSFLLDKIINTFTRHGDRKEKIRQLFYDIMRENGYTPDTFYYIVEALRPRFLNVIARRGREVYRAPITASRTKSIMKAIRFFKKAVMARRYEKTLRLKIEAELREFLAWRGYKNKFFEEYVDLAKTSMHLQHFRSKRVY